MDRYSTNNKGLAPALSDILQDYGNSPRSPFDESSRKCIDVSPFFIIPIDIIKLLPNTDVNVSYDVQVLNKNPTIRRMLSSMTLELRSYAVKDSDCWEGFNNFVTCGRSGTVVKQIPKLDWSLGRTEFSTCLPYNPYFALNIAPARWFAKATDSDPSAPFSFAKNQGCAFITSLQDSGLTGIPSNVNDNDSVLGEVSALPAVFYTKIAQEFQNPNLLQNNPYWYPENENHSLILPYEAEGFVTNSSHSHCTQGLGKILDGIYTDSIVPTNDKKSMPWLNVLYQCQRRGNYFNTGSPFPNLLRGEVPTLDILGARLDWTNVIKDYMPGLNGFPIGYDFINDTMNIGTIRSDTGQVSNTTEAIQSLLKASLNRVGISAIEFSLSNWRKLAVMTLFREKMARTDGSYNQMIQSQFGVNPKWHEHGVRYIGGSTQPIIFSEVTQTSSDAATPLGTTAGRFVSASQNNRITYHSEDFGMIMTVCTIVPDDYYCQGINRLWSAIDNATIPFPVMNNLDPQAILNKELFISGNNTVDNDVFAYAELFSEWKSCRNEISGLLALPISKVGDVGCYFFNRLLGSSPNFNWNFVQGTMTDNENLCFSSTEQAQFILSIARQKHIVYPLPQVAKPSNMGVSFA